MLEDEIARYWSADERAERQRGEADVSPELRFVMFVFPLPDPLPVPDGAFYSFQLDEEIEGLPPVPVKPTPSAAPFPWEPGHNIVSCRFWRVTAPPLSFTARVEAIGEAVEKALPPEFHASNSRGEGSEVALQESEPYATAVEAVTLVRELDEAALSDAFDRCLEKAALVVRAYRLYSQHPIRHLSYERLDPVVVYATRAIDGEWEPPLSLMFLHLGVGGAFFPEELTDDALRALSGRIYVALRDHPLEPYAERRLDARIALHVDGDYGEAVVQAQIAAEVLLDNTLALMLWEEGMDPAEAATGAFSEQLSRRTRTQYHPRLGGDWRHDGNGAVAQWRKKIAKIRNRVVHGSYRATRAEAMDALTTADALEGFLRARIAARKKRYPRTALLALGRPGLEMEGAWTRDMQRLAKSVDEPDWLTDFNAWRNRLTDARSA